MTARSIVRKPRPSGKRHWSGHGTPVTPELALSRPIDPGAAFAFHTVGSDVLGAWPRLRFPEPEPEAALPVRHPTCNCEEIMKIGFVFLAE